MPAQEHQHTVFRTREENTSPRELHLSEFRVSGFRVYGVEGVWILGCLGFRFLFGPLFEGVRVFRLEGSGSKELWELGSGCGFLPLP